MTLTDAQRIDALEAQNAEILAILRGMAKAPKKAKKAPKPPVSAPKVEDDEKFDISAMRDAREDRWNEGKYASSGMTSAQRRAVAATLPKGYTRRQFNAACKVFKAGGFR